jgi:electron-transferring-flavoprotein dehydrogenase
VIEKGVEIGAHIRSGAVTDPRALYELDPDWIEKGAPLRSTACLYKGIWHGATL